MNHPTPSARTRSNRRERRRGFVDGWLVGLWLLCLTAMVGGAWLLFGEAGAERRTEASGGVAVREAAYPTSATVSGKYVTQKIRDLQVPTWVPAGDLSIGETLLSADSPLQRLTAVLVRGNTEAVFNLEVDGEHTYFVSRHGILVHNACAGDIGERYAKNWLRKNGCEVLGSVKNASNHGIDLVARNKKTGMLTIVEAKYGAKQFTSLSSRQANGFKWFVDDVLRKATAANGHWAHSRSGRFASGLLSEASSRGFSGILLRYSIAGRKIAVDMFW